MSGFFAFCSAHGPALAFGVCFTTHERWFEMRDGNENRVSVMFYREHSDEVIGARTVYDIYSGLRSTNMIRLLMKKCCSPYSKKLLVNSLYIIPQPVTLAYG